jgi:micrococcal nuclease
VVPKLLKSILHIVTTSLLITSLSSCASAPGEKVCSVHDGDTFTTCSGTKIRLAGIDAPELRQSYGQAARNELASLVLNQSVQLSCNGKSYQRLTCQVSLNGTDINGEMVSSGYAFDYPHYSHGFYQNQEQQAKEAGLGVWQATNGGQRPWAYRHTSHGGRRKKQNHWVSESINE